MTAVDHGTDSKTKIFQDYFKEVRTKYLTKDFTEHSLRTPFENFIKNLNGTYALIQEPKRQEGVGVPDFKAFKKGIKIGYIETKDLNVNLDEELKSEQIDKYKSSINNLILTNYHRFIFIQNNRPNFDFSLFSLSDLDNPRFLIQPEKIEESLRMIGDFFDYGLPTIKSASELSMELSKKTRLLKILSKRQLEEDILNVPKNGTTSSVFDFYEGAKELIKDISVDDCADAYAETITYGLFLAKLNDPQNLDRNSASALYLAALVLLNEYS